MKITIAEKRKALKMTQPQLAELLNVPYTQIQHWEKGRRIPAADTAVRLARALNTTVEELFIIED